VANFNSAQLYRVNLVITANTNFYRTAKISFCRLIDLLVIYKFVQPKASHRPVLLYRKLRWSVWVAVSRDVRALLFLSAVDDGTAHPRRSQYLSRSRWYSVCWISQTAAHLSACYPWHD